jgi:hypothetical protein
VAAKAYATTPSQHAQVEVKRWLGVAAGDQDRKERHDAEHNERQPQEAKITWWGIASGHFTNQSQRLSCASNCPSP